jgi:N-methylhydantoinase B
MPLKAGDMVRIETAIGGGFGNPLERDPKLVAEDVREGYLPREDAEAAYGVVLDDALEVDEAATEALREELTPVGAGSHPARDYPAREPSFQPAGASA